MTLFMCLWTTVCYQEPTLLSTGSISHHGSKADVKSLDLTEKKQLIHVPINPSTGLHQVHYTWAGAAVLEALCLVFPTVNFALTDSDCVPSSLFEVAELVNLMTDKASRAEAMQHYTMASSSQCPPAVLLTTEAKAELNAGLITVTGHAPTHTADVDMDQATPDASMPPVDAAGSDVSDARAPKARRIVHPANSKSADEWVAALCTSRANFLATTAVKRRINSYTLTWM